MKLWHEIFILLFVVFYGTLGIVLLGTWMWQVAGTLLQRYRASSGRIE